MLDDRCVSGPKVDVKGCVEAFRFGFVQIDLHLHC